MVNTSEAIIFLLLMIISMIFFRSYLKKAFKDYRIMIKGKKTTGLVKHITEEMDDELNLKVYSHTIEFEDNLGQIRTLFLNERSSFHLPLNSTVVVKYDPSNPDHIILIDNNIILKISIGIIILIFFSHTLFLVVRDLILWFK